MRAAVFDAGLEICSSNAAAGFARSYVRAELCRLGLASAIEDAILVATELVTNAVNASPPESSIRLSLGWHSRGLVFAVWDGNTTLPVRRDIAPLTPEAVDRLPDEPGGWGLGLVEALAREAWTEPADPGKWVCASLNI
ncbi:hypothetical protein GCM10010191_74900 [Actinomadura vinacea]|uniref:Histidine kinase/HSP90-like ATPase domain-containing protein n=1 Tax=Actinomadura vinacea TaxID=115336 RepID=A0ABN3K4R1_9ACTN